MNLSQNATRNAATNANPHANTAVIGEPLACYDHSVAQRVQGWIDSGRPLVWIPILNQENFPDVPFEDLKEINARRAAMHVPIHQPSDLLRMPEGVTGWLMPEGDTDTDVACGVWNGEVYILGAKDKRDGRKQTLVGSMESDAEGSSEADGDDPQSAV
ncbi:MAG: hypothetical protein LHW57_04325 [Candidatus Cloacimonetes bacterium]|jgi:hypothetical protein|nr:hypothetical protein [Candidatus Cloacimonadota bacterium]